MFTMQAIHCSIQDISPIHQISSRTRWEHQARHTSENKRSNRGRSASVGNTPALRHTFGGIQSSTTMSQMEAPSQDVAFQGQTTEGHTILAQKHKSRDETFDTYLGHLHQTAPEKAINTLKAFVFFSVLSPTFIASRIPTMMTRMKTSPTEDTANDILETRFRDNDSNLVCSSSLDPS